MTRRDRERLADVVEAIDAIRSHLERGDLSDGLVFDAVRLRLIEIGEAVKGLTPALASGEPDIPWDGVAGMRDWLVHHYFDTSHAIVQATVEEDLPRLEAAVRRLGRQAGPPDEAHGTGTVLDGALTSRAGRGAGAEDAAGRTTSSMQHPFLSDQWIEEARAIRSEYRERLPPVPHAVRMNLVVTDLPFGDGQLDAHLDTAGGEIELDKGHLDQPDLTVTVDYATARAILVDGDPQAGMQAFMAGKVQVDGDMTKLLVLQAGPPVGDAGHELAGRLRGITA